MFREARENLDRFLSAKKHVRIVLARKAREGPNIQDKAEHLTGVGDSFFEDMTATCHPTGIVGGCPSAERRVHVGFVCRGP